jgi:hypothetical protein
MANERQAMYDGFSDTGKHSVEWVQITKEFLKLAFAGGRCDRVVGCDPSYGVQIKVELLESVLQRYREVDY